MKKLICAALLAGIALPAQAAVTIRYNLTFVNAHQKVLTAGLEWDDAVEGTAWFTLGQPTSATATQSAIVAGDTLTIDWLNLSPSLPNYHYEIKTILKFDHDLGGVVPTDMTGFLSAGSSFYSFVYFAPDTSALTEGGITLDSIVVSDLPTVERGGDPFFQLVAPPDQNAVPEPASWAMMIAGFALAGGALRSRFKTVRGTVSA